MDAFSPSGANYCWRSSPPKLKSLEEEGRQIDRNLQLVGIADTSAAFDFRNQLTAAQLLLEIESGDASLRIDRLREYLAKNY